MDKKATIAGALAVATWSVMAAFLRSTTESFGHLGGIALIYTLGAALLFIVNRPNALRDIPKRYLIVGGTLFAAYEICLALAIALAETHLQVIEVSILNYLWPSLTAILWALNRKTGRCATLLRMLPSLALVICGTILAVGGTSLFFAHDDTPPSDTSATSYALAAAASIIWAVYTNYTPALAKDKNATSYFFVLVSIVLWAVLAISGERILPPSDMSYAVIPLIGATLSVALGYALWNYAINHGDIGVLSIISYSAPVLSCIATALLLGVAPDAFLWVGVILVSAGSLCGYLAKKAIERHNGDNG